MKHTELFEHTYRITHLSGFTNYTYVHFADAPDLLISRPISFCLQQLPDFLRIHKRYAVNPRFIHQVRHFDSGMVEVRINKNWLPISRRRKKETIQQLQAYFQPSLILGLPPARTF